MSDLRAMQRLCGLMRKAVQDYEMIAPGDRVMVGVSGGKDSVALTIGLAELRKYIGFDFTVQAVTLDPQFGGRPMDYTVLQELFAQYDIPYEIRRTEIGPVVFDYRKEKNPCALCAKLRRGALHTAASRRSLIFRAGTSPSSGPCCWPPSRRSFPQCTPRGCPSSRASALPTA